MSAGFTITPAKLVCVSTSTLDHCARCATLPAFYRIVWQIPPAMVNDRLALARLQKHFLFGKVLCAN